MTSQSLRIIFAGTPAFSAQHLEALLAAGHHLVGVMTQPDRPSGRGKKVTTSPVKKLALRHALPLFQEASLRQAVLQQQLAALQADVMVVVAYGLILPPSLLSIPRLGCINVHASLLPRWRGAAPIQRALLAGDSATGITIMQMDAGLDSGPMLQQVVCRITAQETSSSLYDKLADIGPPALLHSLQQLIMRQSTLSPQNHALATYAEKIKKQEAELDWQLSALVLERYVRAFNPWPLSYFRVAGHVIKVWQAKALLSSGSAEQNMLIAPKTITGADRRGIHIATGAGTLVLQQLQLAGKRPISAQDLLNAHGDWFTLGSSLE